MSKLATVVADLDVGQSIQDLTSLVRDFEEVRVGLAESGKVLAYLASIDKLKTILDIAGNDAHPLQNAAIAVEITLKTREGFSFDIPEANLMLQAFVLASVLTQEQADIVKAIGSTTEKPFANISEKRVQEVRQ